VDPFRDELTAAHEKIAHLEEQVRHLELANRAAHPPANRGSKVAVVVGVAFVLGLAIAGFLLLTIRSTASASGPATFRGIATATAAVADRAPVSPVIAARPTPIGAVSSKPCHCDPADPLCSCL